MLLVEKTYDTGEIVINFAEGENNGPPLVLLHGGTVRWQMWNDFDYIPVLAESWQIFAPDLRGHGKTGKGKSGYSFGNFGNDITAFIEGQVGKPVVLIGGTWGAMIALMAAARAPGLVRALVLLEPGLRYFCDSWPGKFQGIFEYFRWLEQTLASSESLEDVAACVMELEPNNDETANLNWAETIYQLDLQFVSHILHDPFCKGYHPEQLLQQVTSPALLVYGEPDLGSILNDEDIALFKEHVPHGQTFHARGAGHADVIWDPAGPAVLEQVVQFLNLL